MLDFQVLPNWHAPCTRYRQYGLIVPGVVKDSNPNDHGREQFIQFPRSSMSRETQSGASKRQ